MVRLSMNEMTTYRWSFEEDVVNYTAAGYAGICVWRQKLSDFGEERGVELLLESGLHVAGLFWAGGFTGSDGQTHRECVRDTLDAIRLAAQMRADCVVLYSGSRAGHTLNHARRLLLDALLELVPVAEKHNVALAIEPMHRACAKNSTFLTCCNHALDIIQQINSPALKLVFDTYYWGHEAEVLARLPQIAPHVGLVQLGDSRRPPDSEQNRCRLDDGTVPLREVVAGLSAAGYDGFYDVELLGEDIEYDDYSSLLEHSKIAARQLLDCALV